MEIEYTISLQGVSKSFRRVGKRSSYTTVKSLLLSLITRKPKETQKSIAHNETIALRDITLRVPRGASFGVIGKNGSGKSTLLKLITGIYKPDEGTISCAGSISALIELGAGFHPDFTGRENVYLGGMIQGLSRREIDERFHDIVSFAELEEYIDEPVRT
ncbi:MAG: ATP-binding cassette domain-containing protein, partial [Bdellovibrionales bacterium]|nr:ATP-binding cassette domain-containing protein [Bdellovibrionales bacterium]